MRIRAGGCASSGGGAITGPSLAADYTSYLMYLSGRLLADSSGTVRRVLSWSCTARAGHTASLLLALPVDTRWSWVLELASTRTTFEVVLCCSGQHFVTIVNLCWRIISETQRL